MIVRVICVSRPLPADKAVQFARQFKDLFEPLFIWSETRGILRREGFHHHYYVARIPHHTESRIPGHEMNVDVREILGMIPAYKRVHSPTLSSRELYLRGNG